MLKDSRINISVDAGSYLPDRAHDADAGYDLRAPKVGFIPKGGSLVIDTGVHMEIPEGYCGKLCSKSGLNVRFGIISDGLIDSGYTGSIKVKLYNLSNAGYVIEAGDKISQIVLLPVATPELNLVAVLDDTERGDKGFGSTGR